MCIGTVAVELNFFCSLSFVLGFKVVLWAAYHLLLLTLGSREKKLEFYGSLIAIIVMAIEMFWRGGLSSSFKLCKSNTEDCHSSEPLSFQEIKIGPFKLNPYCEIRWLEFLGFSMIFLCFSTICGLPQTFTVFLMPFERSLY